MSNKSQTIFKPIAICLVPYYLVIMHISPFSIMWLNSIDKKRMVLMLKFNLQIFMAMTVKFISQLTEFANRYYLSMVTFCFAKFNPFLKGLLIMTFSKFDYFMLDQRIFFNSLKCRYQIKLLWKIELCH